VIAGGSRGESASDEILSFDPSTGLVRRIGRLPSAITHAPAVSLGAHVYVLGGRGSASGSQSSAIVAIDPRSGAAERVGHLPAALSDASASVLAGRVLLAGGRRASGTTASVLELNPKPAPAK
jgi:N-acetylneuraminic acid mutarotase